MMCAFRQSIMLVIAGFVLLSAAPPAPATGMLFDADGIVTGRDVLGMSYVLGEGPFQIFVKLDNADQLPDPNQPAGIDQWTNAFRHFEMRLPMIGLTLGGETNENTAAASRNDPNFDQIRFDVLNCIDDHCEIPTSTLGNTVDLGFEGLFLGLDLPPSTLPTGFSTLRELERYVDGIDAASTLSFARIFYVPADLLPMSTGSSTGGDVIAMGNGGDMPDIRFLQVFGAITDVTIVPEPGGAALLACALMTPIGARFRRRPRPTRG